MDIASLASNVQCYVGNDWDLPDLSTFSFRMCKRYFVYYRNSNIYQDRSYFSFPQFALRVPLDILYLRKVLYHYFLISVLFNLLCLLGRPVFCGWTFVLCLSHGHSSFLFISFLCFHPLDSGIIVFHVAGYFSEDISLTCFASNTDFNSLITF